MQTQLTPRQITNRAKKEAKRIEIEKNQKPVKEITINIEWVESRMWGNNPKCEARVTYQDGSFERSPTFKASGCGYDKESTVIASVFNMYLKYKLWALPESVCVDESSELHAKRIRPYGVYISRRDTDEGIREWRDFAGGIGTSCYYDICKFIGGKFEQLANGKTFDVYKYTDGKGEV